LGSYLTDAYSGDVRCRKEVSERLVLRIYPLIVHPPNVVTIVAWAGVGKSTLVNHWLDEWLLNIIVLRSLFLAGPSTGRVPVGTLHRQMNFSMLE
jgi:hypothetical protein